MRLYCSKPLTEITTCLKQLCTKHFKSLFLFINICLFFYCIVNHLNPVEFCNSFLQSRASAQVSFKDCTAILNET